MPCLNVVAVHQTSQTENTFQKVRSASTQQIFGTQAREHEIVTTFNLKSQLDILRQQAPTTVTSIETGSTTWAWAPII